MMMKSADAKEDAVPFFRPTIEVKQAADDYQPMQDTLADFYLHGSSLTDPSSSYTLAPVTYAIATPPVVNYYEMPQMSLYPQDFEPVQNVYVSPSPTYSPPPQDPQVTKTPKKRIAAVPCHSNSICANCKTKETTLWRRNHIGEIECNACNLYYRKNNRKRPLSLRKDGILKRNRKPRCESPARPRP